MGSATPGVGRTMRSTTSLTSRVYTAGSTDAMVPSPRAQCELISSSQGVPDASSARSKASRE